MSTFIAGCTYFCEIDVDLEESRIVYKKDVPF